VEEVKLQTARRKKALYIGTGVVGVLVIVAVVIGLLFPGLFGPKSVVLATVGEDEITLDAFQERVRYYRWQFLQQYGQISQVLSYFGDYDGNQQNQLNQIASLLNTPDMFGEIVLNSMVDEIILTRQAKELGLEITDEALALAIQEAFGYDPDAVEVEAEPVDDALYADPEAQPTPYTIDMFEENYADYLESLAIAQVSEAEFREVQEMSMLHNEIYEALTADYVPATEEKVWARHILVEDEATALSVIEQLENGSKTFEELALEFSIDTGSGSNGGDLGWFGRGMMIPEFEEPAFSLEIGEISEPIESQFGFHIIEVLGHEDQLISEDQQNYEKQQLFGQWLENEFAAIESTVVIDEELLAVSVPMEPSFSDPVVYEAIFGVPPEEQDAGTEE
jgi:parvulin-like peptidyl-prolyl isomerase